MIFNALSNKISSSLAGICGKRIITNSSIQNVLNEIEDAFLNADVHKEALNELIEKSKNRILGIKIKKTINPSGLIVNILYEELAIILGQDREIIKHKKEMAKKNALNKESILSPVVSFNKSPSCILIAGLQGSGKTTTAAKIAKRLSQFNKKKVLLTSLDLIRPAAREQLKILGQQAGIPVFEFEGSVMEIAKNALKYAKNEKFDVVIFDTAGRTNLDLNSIEELRDIDKIINPENRFLVMDAAIGQQAYNIAKTFDEAIDINGLVFTRLDGDTKGGAVVSACYITKKPVLFICTGESLQSIQEFRPERVASQILGSGDLMSLVEKAKVVVGSNETAGMEEKLKKGEFSMDDFSYQMKLVQKMGGMKSLLSFLPSSSMMPQGFSSNLFDDREIKENLAIISSMTKKERKHPSLFFDTKLASSRKLRVANGSGLKMSAIERLLQKYLKISSMVRRMSKVDMGKIKDINGVMDALKKMR